MSAAIRMYPYEATYQVEGQQLAGQLVGKFAT
ncbi:hypothetical protein FHS89_000659 [Rubricella aquisinus]|uniref:Uncharacterized protein n=1 Tax=Rubricella aquisinus TaxID=2028108 RepID=A0A840WKF4_9RHOB|nr:hypothetical protein [Rubricella aquisinus]